MIFSGFFLADLLSAREMGIKQPFGIYFIEGLSEAEPEMLVFDS